MKPGSKKVTAKTEEQPATETKETAKEEVKAEIYRMKDTMTRNIHHSITQYGTKEDTDSLWA